MFNLLKVRIKLLSFLLGSFPLLARFWWHHLIYLVYSESAWAFAAGCSKKDNEIFGQWSFFFWEYSSYVFIKISKWGFYGSAVQKAQGRLSHQLPSASRKGRKSTEAYVIQGHYNKDYIMPTAIMVLYSLQNAFLCIIINSLFPWRRQQGESKIECDTSWVHAC